MVIILGNDDNATFKALSQNIVGSTGIFIFDEDNGGLLVIVEKGQGYEMTDISEVLRKNAPESGLKAIDGGKK